MDILQVCDLCRLFNVFLPLYMLKSEMEVIKCSRLFTEQHCDKNQQMHEYMGSKLNIISSYLGFVSNILTLPFVICVDKQTDCGKISSWYFSELLSVPRHKAYPPIPT